MCKEQFNERTRTPMLLPDCGHSYCIQCIEENSNEIGFNLRRRMVVVTPTQDDEDGAQAEANDAIADDDDDEDLTKDVSSPFVKNTAMSDGSPSSIQSPASKPKFTFACPEDG